MSVVVLRDTADSLRSEWNRNRERELFLGFALEIITSSALRLRRDKVGQKEKEEGEGETTRRCLWLTASIIFILRLLDLGEQDTGDLDLDVYFSVCIFTFEYPFHSVIRGWKENLLLFVSSSIFVRWGMRSVYRVTRFLLLYIFILASEIFNMIFERDRKILESFCKKILFPLTWIDIFWLENIYRGARLTGRIIIIFHKIDEPWRPVSTRK